MSAATASLSGGAPRVSVAVRIRRAVENVLWAVGPFATLIVVWQLIVNAAIVPPIWLPSPLKVWAAFQELLDAGTFFEHMQASLGRLLLGITVSGGLGVSLGVLMGLRRGVADFVGPLVNFLNAIGGIVWIPLAILWFGLGVVTVTFIIWNAMFFLILFNTLLGVKSVPRTYESAIRTMGGGRWRVITDVLVPGALPNIVTGIRLGMAFGWRALIAAELFAASSGLGFLIFKASYGFRSDTILVCLITIGSTWLFIDRVVLVPFERWTIRRWRLVTTE